MKIEIEIPEEVVQKIEDNVLEKVAQSVKSILRIYRPEKNRKLFSCFQNLNGIRDKLNDLEYYKKWADESEKNREELRQIKEQNFKFRFGFQ